MFGRARLVLLSERGAHFDRQSNNKSEGLFPFKRGKIIVFAVIVVSDNFSDRDTSMVMRTDDSNGHRKTVRDVMVYHHHHTDSEGMSVCMRSSRKWRA